VTSKEKSGKYNRVTGTMETVSEKGKKGGKGGQVQIASGCGGGKAVNAGALRMKKGNMTV